MCGKTDRVMVPRQTTGTTDMKVAEAQRAELIKSSKDEKVYGRRLDDVIEEFLASRKEEVTEGTYEQIENALTRLKDYCTSKNVHHAAELNVDLLESFKTNALTGLKSTSKSTLMYKVRAFLRDAYRRDWITQPLVEKLKPVKAVYEQKDPYTEDELTLILDEALNLNGGTHGFAGKPRTFRLLLELMLETGMRVGDAIRFDPKSVMKGDHLWIYTYEPQKQKKAEMRKVHEVYLTDKMMTAIHNTEGLSKTLPFHYGASASPHYLANQAYIRMQTIGDRCGVADCRPHRLRDTFAVRKLLAGVSIDDVSKLLGHSSVKITESYYAKWIPARKKRLEGIFAQSLLNT